MTVVVSFFFFLGSGWIFKSRIYSGGNLLDPE